MGKSACRANDALPYIAVKSSPRGSWVKTHNPLLVNHEGQSEHHCTSDDAENAASEIQVSGYADRECLGSRRLPVRRLPRRNGDLNDPERDDAKGDEAVNDDEAVHQGSLQTGLGVTLVDASNGPPSDHASVRGVDRMVVQVAEHHEQIVSTATQFSRR